MDAREVAKHSSAASCWVVIHGHVYDVTNYLSEHPGGSSVLLKLAGKDATLDYTTIHSSATVRETLPKAKQLGPIDPSTAQYLDNNVGDQKLPKPAEIPHISLCVRLDDFIDIARMRISKQAFTYISSAADTMQSHHDNLAQWSKVTFIPRVLRDVSQVDISTSILGQQCSLPLFIAATGLVGLTHPEGEAGLARAAAMRGVHYSPSTYTSIPHATIAESHKDAIPTSPGNSCLFFQLYVHDCKEKTLSLIQDAKRLGFRGLMITVDTPCVGNRDEDRRLKAQDALELSGSLGNESTKVVPGSNNGGLSRSLNWADLTWIRQAWGGPIALKGIQSAEDARLAMEAGVEAVYLSNHGGRQLHSAPPCLATLAQIRRRYPEVLHRCEILVDGGVMRGGDILKAICLGAKAVGIGRPLLYAMGAYGTEGVLKAIEILKHELETTMTLLGATSLSQLSAHMVNAMRIEQDLSEPVSENGVPCRL